MVRESLYIWGCVWEKRTGIFNKHSGKSSSPLKDSQNENEHDVDLVRHICGGKQSFLPETPPEEDWQAMEQPESMSVSPWKHHLFRSYTREEENDQ